MTDWHWWQRGIIYQVYPRSFQDSDGDGVGDLRGAASRLDHLVRLGVDAVWLSPIYPSPMADFGYDIADYCDVDPTFGTLADFDAFAAAARDRGLRVILDYVPNHTSDRHPWFLESRAARQNARRDWYIWRDPAPDGGPPNNWLSRFGGSAWEWDAGSGQYYLHSFLTEQPDLNWRSADVRAAMYDLLRFWMRRGVDGFRVDVLWLLIKDEAFRDDPPNPDWGADMQEFDRLLPVWNSDRPETLDVLAEMRAVVDEFPERVLIGEVYLPLPRLMAYYGRDAAGGAQLPFNFSLVMSAWDAKTIAGVIRDYEGALPAGAWPNWVLGNHDQKRVASRIGPAQARVAAMLLLTLRGTPTIYQGEEIGMTDGAIPPDAVRDPAEKRQPGLGLGRDPQRTPLPWDGSHGGGFTTGAPWLPIGGGANVADEQAAPGSMLRLYQALIALRQASTALATGAVEQVEADGDVLRYQRRLGEERMLVVLAMAGGETTRPCPAGRIVLSTFLDRTDEAIGDRLRLRGDEGVVISLHA